MSTWSRRDFLQFIGVSGAAATIAGCSLQDNKRIVSLKPSSDDDVKLIDGLSYQVLIKEGDVINSKGEMFGHNNDYTALLPIPGKSENEKILWVNHEYPNFKITWLKEASKEEADKQIAACGGSLIHIKKLDSGHWQFVKNSPYNKRIDGKTLFKFADNVKIQGQSTAKGTFANCSGGTTPWNTVLTCEENYDNFVGEYEFSSYYDESSDKIKNGWMQWEKFYPEMSPLHYGWVVEIDPLTGKGKKLTGLGRFAHESATCVNTAKTPVVYSGDDRDQQFIYKFVSDEKNSLDRGTLYVADIVHGKWLPMDLEKSPILKKTFKTNLDVRIFARLAAKILGATPMNRPEDIAVNTLTHDIYVSLTKSKSKDDPYGSILRIQEKNGDHHATEFKSSTFVFGGEKSAISCPDNLEFDPNHNLWVTNDISGKSIGKGKYEKFKNNGLFSIPTMGVNAGKVFQIASAPTHAEFTGPTFTKDAKTLFLSVQHPGELSKPDKFTSDWPVRKEEPKSAVITITGPAFDKST